MNKKILLPIVIVAVLVVAIGIYFASQGIKGPEERPAGEKSAVTSEEEPAEGTLEDCIRGAEYGLTDPVSRNQVYSACAMAAKDSNTCAKVCNEKISIEEMKKDCYYQCAFHFKDQSICDRISAESERASCKEIVSQQKPSETQASTEQPTIKTAGEGECPVGTTVTMSGLELKVTGNEKHTIEGKTVNLCCGRIQGTVKTCADKLVGDRCYSITWLPIGGYDIEYPQPGNICSKEFDASGNLIDEECSARDWACE